MRIAKIVGLGLGALLAGCGDNEGLPIDDQEPRCEPPQGALPTVGAFIDPLAIQLPADCVVGGLGDLPGRWFVADPTATFVFEYPKFDGSCETGFRRSFYSDEDHDETDGVSFFTWSDGTRFYNRFSFRFEQPPPEPAFEFTTAFAACMLPDGTLAAVSARFDNDRGERILTMTGKPFAPKDEPASGLELVGEVGAFGPNPEDFISGYNVVVEGTHAYVVGPNGFDVVDVADPANPTPVAHLPGAYNDVRVVVGGGKTVAFLAPIDFEETAVVDVTDPAAPVITQTLPEYSHSIHVVAGATTTDLYLATYGDSVPHYNVTNPIAPVRLGAALVPGDPAGVHDLFVDGNRIFANYTTAGLVVFDVNATSVERGRLQTSYSHASWVGTTTAGRKVILHGDEGMTGTAEGGAFLRILEGDPASPAYMEELARFQTRPEVGIHNIQMIGDKVYLSYYQDGIRILDIADPTQPREVAHFNTWDPATASGSAFEGAVGVRVANGHVFVADLDRGLIILREL